MHAHTHTRTHTRTHTHSLTHTHTLTHTPDTVAAAIAAGSKTMGDSYGWIEAVVRRLGSTVSHCLCDLFFERVCCSCGKYY